MGEVPAQSRAPLLAALALTALHLILAGCWIAEHDLPNGGRDEFFIVEVATELAYRVGEAEWSELRPYLFDNAYYPPLVRLPAVAALAAGGGYGAVVMSGWVWLPFLLLGTWFLGRELSRSPWGGTVALALLLPAPGLADSIHHYESNLGVMAMSACCLAAWIRSDHFKNHRLAVLFGLFLGLGLLADRLGLLPFVLAPCLFSLVRSWGRRTWAGLGLVVLAAGVTAGWWYLDFAERFWHEIIPQLMEGEIDRSGEILEERPPLLLWWLHYLLLWPDSQLGLIGGLLALAALGWSLHRGREEGRSALLLTLLWIGAGVFLFTLAQKRQVYYTLPLLPAATALAAALLLGVRERIPRFGGAVVLGVLLLVQLPAFLTVRQGLVDVGPGLRSWVLLSQSPLPEDLLGGRFPLGGPPHNSGLDLDQTLADQGSPDLDRATRVAVFSTADAQATESYQVSLGRIAIQHAGVYGLTKHPERFYRVAESEDDQAEVTCVADPETRPGLLVFVHRDGGAWPSREQLVAAHDSHDEWKPQFECLAEEVASWQAGAELVAGHALADSERLSLWRLNP